MKKENHKFKVGDIVFAKVYNQKYYGKITKLTYLRITEAAYEVSGFGDTVSQKHLKKSTRKSIPKNN